MTIVGAKSAVPFQLVAGNPVLDLVNTLDWRFRESGSEELLQSYADVVRFLEQAGLLSSGQAFRLVRGTGEGAGARVLARVKELREASAEVFYAGADGQSAPVAALGTLEMYFKEMRANQRVGYEGGRLRWEWASAEDEVELPVWLLALSAQELMTSAEMEMVRACGNVECRWLFLDSSKNHTRRWCDMKLCGNRMKARRFKGRQKAAGV